MAKKVMKTERKTTKK